MTTTASLLRQLAAAAYAVVIASTAFAADPPANDRATPGTVVPSTGVTKADPPATPAPSPARPASSSAGSLSGPPPADCAALRQEYAKSQACFAPYRLANGGLKPEAARRCKEVANPGSRCGPEVVSPK